MKIFYSIILGLMLWSADAFGGVVYSTNFTNNWNNAFTWSTTSLPTVNDTVVILSGHYVNVNSNGFYTQIRALRVESGATIYFMDGAGLEVMDSINNKGILMMTNGGISSGNSFRSDGYINVSAPSSLYVGLNNIGGSKHLFRSDSLVTAGTINVNGRWESTGYLAQTDGSIVVDGNSGTAAGSVEEANPIISINATNANCSGGSITITDPHHSSMFPFVNDVDITGNNINAFSGTHTFYIGDGSSSTAGPVNRGFNFGNGLGSNYAPIQNLVVRSGNGTERQFRTSIQTGGGTYIKGNVSVTNNSDFQHIWVHSPGCAIGGDISVEAGSHFTSSKNVTLGGVQGVYSITTDQEISGDPSYYRNDYIGANVTANFGALTINHANRSEADFSFFMGGISIADSLTMQQGFLRADNMVGAYYLSLGLSTTHPGKLIYQSGNIAIGKMGHMNRWIGAGIIAANDPAGLYPVSYDRDGSFAVGNKEGVRHLQLSGTVTTGGKVSVSLGTFYPPAELPPSQTSTVNGTTIDAYCYGNGWGLSNLNAEGTFNIRGRCGNVITEQNISDLYMRSINTLSGTVTHVNGTGIADSFYIGLNGLNGTDLNNGSFHLSGNKQNLLTRIPSKQSGEYSDTATWKYNIIPSWASGYGTAIMPGHTVYATGNSSYSLLGLEVRQGSTFNVGLGLPYFVSVNQYGTEIAGTVNVEGGALFSSNMQERDTAIWIKPTGVLNNNNDVGTFSPNIGWKNSGFWSEGTLNMQGGNMKIQGAMKFTGNATVNLAGGKIYIDGNSGIDSSSMKDPLFQMATEGAVTAGGTQLYIVNPSRFADTASVIIKRNGTGMDLRKLNVYFGLQPVINFNTEQDGDANTGFKVETKAGTQNIPLGKMFVAGGGSGNGRYVRNGSGGFFAADSVVIRPFSTLWIASDADNYISGHVYNDGYMVSEGRITFGGTQQFPATQPIIVKRGPTGSFQNSMFVSNASFNKLGINSEGPSVVLDFPSTVAQELKLDKGFLMLNAHLTLGTGSSNVGTLLVGTGRIVIQPTIRDIYFKRWFNTSTFNLTDNAGWYPFATPFGEDRSLNLSGTPVTAGMVSVSACAPDVGVANTGTGWFDGGITVNYHRGAMWDVKAESGFSCPSMSLKTISGGLSVGNLSHARLLQANNPGSTPGSHVSVTGTNTAPIITRAGINSVSFTGNIFFGLAMPTGEMTYAIEAVQSGNWNDPATWNCNCIPGSASRAYIANNYHVTVDSSGPKKVAAGVELHNQATISVNGDSLLLSGGFGMYDTTTVNINGGYSAIYGLSTYNGQNYPFGTYLFGGIDPNFDGTLNITGGKLSYGQMVPWQTVYSNGIRLAYTKGNFNMSGGTLDVKGNLFIDSTMDFQMTGGSIYLDGNSPQTDTTYILHGYPIFELHGAQPGKSIQITGGDIYILNPARFDDYSFKSFSRRLNTATNLAGSTIHFGKSDMNESDISYNQTLVLGTLNQPTGFKVYTGENNGTQWPVPMGNVVIDGNDGISGRRHVFVDYGFHAKGDVTINPNSEWRLYYSQHDQYIGGDLTNNGILTSQNAILNFGGENFVVTNPQTLSGTGRFRSNIADILPVSNEPSISKMTFNNFSSEGVTVDVPDLRTFTMTMQNGDVHIANGNSLIFGASFMNLAPFLFDNGTGSVIGKLKRYIYGGIPQDYVFPVGVAGNRRSANITYTTAPVADGYLTAEFIPLPPGNAGLPLTEGTIDVNQTGTAGYWRFTPENISTGQYDITAEAKNFNGIGDYTKLVLLKRDNNAANWTLQGMHITTTGSNATPVLRRNGLTGFSEFGVGGDASINPLPLQLLSFNAVREGATARLQWKTAREVNMDGYIIERSTDGKHFEELGRIKALNNNENTYTYYDRQPVPGMNYYRLNMISGDGKKEYSSIRVLHFGDTGTAINVYPNPATGILYIRSSVAITQVQMTDNLGRTVYIAQPASDQVQIAVEGMAKGQYNLEILTANGREVRKVQVQ